MQGLPYWGIGVGVPSTSQNFAHPPPPRKIPLTKSQSSPPCKQQFSSYNPIKTVFLAVVIAPDPVIENNRKIILMIISII